MSMILASSPYDRDWPFRIIAVLSGVFFDQSNINWGIIDHLSETADARLAILVMAKCFAHSGNTGAGFGERASRHLITLVKGNSTTNFGDVAVRDAAFEPHNLCEQVQKT